MKKTSNRTISANKDTVNKDWIVVDANSQILGRFASRVAYILMGKHKPNFTPHVDCGDNVIIINAEKVKFTGNKLKQKEYLRYTGYPGGERVRTAEQMFTKFPERVIEMAVRRMLPKNRLGRKIFGNLHVYAGIKHSHDAQQPKFFDINKIK